jgi:hypothetical protein
MMQTSLALGQPEYHLEQARGNIRKTTAHDEKTYIQCLLRGFFIGK